MVLLGLCRCGKHIDATQNRGECRGFDKSSLTIVASKVLLALTPYNNSLATLSERLVKPHWEQSTLSHNCVNDYLYQAGLASYLITSKTAASSSSFYLIVSGFSIDLR